LMMFFIINLDIGNYIVENMRDNFN
jgi:hypothetical protein